MNDNQPQHNPDSSYSNNAHNHAAQPVAAAPRKGRKLLWILLAIFIGVPPLVAGGCVALAAVAVIVNPEQAQSSESSEPTDTVPMPDSKRDYIGEWTGSGVTLTITPDGDVQYERINGSGTKRVTAPIQAWHGADFEVGVLFVTTTFDVIVPPHEENRRWKMTVDGVELTKVLK